MTGSSSTSFEEGERWCLGRGGRLPPCDLSRGPHDAGVELQQYPGRHTTRAQTQDERMRTAYNVWVDAGTLWVAWTLSRRALHAGTAQLRWRGLLASDVQTAQWPARRGRFETLSDKQRSTDRRVCEHALGKAGSRVKRSVDLLGQAHKQRRETLRDKVAEARMRSTRCSLASWSVKGVMCRHLGWQILWRCGTRHPGAEEWVLLFQP